MGLRFSDSYVREARDAFGEDADDWLEDQMSFIMDDIIERFCQLLLDTYPKEAKAAVDAAIAATPRIDSHYPMEIGRCIARAVNSFAKKFLDRCASDLIRISNRVYGREEKTALSIAFYGLYDIMDEIYEAPDVQAFWDYCRAHHMDRLFSDWDEYRYISSGIKDPCGSRQIQQLFRNKSNSLGRDQLLDSDCALLIADRMLDPYSELSEAHEIYAAYIRPMVEGIAERYSPVLGFGFDFAYRDKLRGVYLDRVDAFAYDVEKSRYGGFNPSLLDRYHIPQTTRTAKVPAKQTTARKAPAKKTSAGKANPRPATAPKRDAKGRFVKSSSKRTAKPKSKGARRWARPTTPTTPASSYGSSSTSPTRTGTARSSPTSPTTRSA